MSEKHNPDRYRELSKPFESIDAANKALELFYEELAELRAKHKIQDVLTVVQVTMLHEDGEEGQAFTSMHCGSELAAEGMAAWAYGSESAKRQERITKLATQAAATRKRSTR